MNIFIAYYFKDGAFNTTKNVGKNFHQLKNLKKTLYEYCGFVTTKSYFCV